MNRQNNDRPDELRNKVVSGLKWTFLARFSAQLITWSITILVVRFLQPDDYGLKSMADVIFSMLFLLSISGINTALMQTQTLSERLIQQVFGCLLLINLCLFFLQFLTAPFIADYFQEPQLEPVVRLLACGFLLSPFVAIPEAILERRMAFKQKSLIDLNCNVLTSLLTLLLAILGLGVWALIIGQLTLMLLRAIGLNRAARCLKHPDFHWTEIMPLLRFGGIVMLTTLLWVISNKIDIIIIGRQLDTAQIGLYAFALFLSAVPLEKIMPHLTQVALSAYSAIQDRPDDAARYFLKSVRICSFVMFPVFYGMAATAHQFIPLILEEKWQATIEPLTLLCLVFPLRAVGFLFAPVLSGTGKPHVPLGNTLVSLVILSPAFWVGARHGVIGLAYAWVIASPLIFAINAVRTTRALGVSAVQLATALIAPFLAALAMFWGIQSSARLLFGEAVSWPAFICLALIGTAFYGTIMWLSRRALCLEIRGFLQR